MANVKITELTNLTDPSTTDVMPVVDVDADVTKKVSVGEVVGKITGDVEVATDGTATISELPVSKLQDGAARQLLQTDAAGTDVEWTDNVDVPGTLDVTGAATFDATINASGLASLDGGIDVDGAFTVANTSGNVATSGTLGVTGQSTLASAAVSDLTSGRVVLVGTSGELEDNAGLTFNGTQLDVDGDIVITGDLTVEGASTILETETVKVEDKNIELGVVASPTDVTADGGGITLKGDTDKTITWSDATDAWTSSEHIELASGKEFYIDGNGVLNATTLGSGVVNSSLTSVGTIVTGTWQGTAIDAAYLDLTVVTTSDTGTVTSTMILDGTIVNGDINASAAIADTKLDTISTAGKVSNSATTATDANTASAIVARDASGDFAAGTITADLTGNAATATKLDSSRTFEVTGDVTGTVSSDLISGASIATSIASGVIVDSDVNASAAIAGTKIDPDFGSQTVETTGVFSAAGGAEATPSITFTGDLDTGIYSPGANELAISSNGTERVEFGTSEVVFNDGGANYDFRVEGDTEANLFFVDASTDRVGLGISSPAALLDVATNDGSATATIRISNTAVGATPNNSTSALEFYSGDLSAPAGASVRAKIDIYANANGGASDLRFLTNNTSGGIDERIRIDGLGRVGIGVTSASSLLHLADAGDITVGTTTGTKIGTATTQKLGFYNATPVVQPTAVADITTTATSGSLPTPDGSVTIADAATPTVTELLEYCVELEAKLEAALGHLRTLGLIAT